MANRKYYKIHCTRVCPYSAINGTYEMDEHVYAYSPSGAINTFLRYHKKGFGSYIVHYAEEITKEEFKGHHEWVIGG